MCYYITFNYQVQSEDALENTITCKKVKAFSRSMVQTLMNKSDLLDGDSQEIRTYHSLPLFSTFKVALTS